MSIKHNILSVNKYTSLNYDFIEHVFTKTIVQIRNYPNVNLVIVLYAFVLPFVFFKIQIKDYNNAL